MCYVEMNPIPMHSYVSSDTTPNYFESNLTGIMVYIYIYMYVCGREGGKYMRIHAHLPH